MMHLCLLVPWSVLRKRAPTAPLRFLLSGLYGTVGEASVQAGNLVINFTSVKLYTRSGLQCGVNLMPSPSNDYAKFGLSL